MSAFCPEGTGDCDGNDACVVGHPCPSVQQWAFVRRINCAHCDATRRDVSLWDQILGTTAGTVCCWAQKLEVPYPSRTTHRTPTQSERR